MLVVAWVNAPRCLDMLTHQNTLNLERFGFDGQSASKTVVFVCQSAIYIMVHGCSWF